MDDVIFTCSLSFSGPQEPSRKACHEGCGYHSRNLCALIGYTVVKENDMRGAYILNGGKEKHVYVIGGKARRKETTKKTYM
jgi:hypothetical protein